MAITNLDQLILANKTNKDGGQATTIGTTKIHSPEINAIFDQWRALFEVSGLDTSTISVNSDGTLVNPNEIVKAIQNFAWEKHLSATGTDTYSISLASTNLLPKSLLSGFKISFTIPNTNTTTSITLAISGLHSAKKLFALDGTTTFAIGDFVTGSMVLCAYDTTLDSGSGGYKCVIIPVKQVNSDWNASSGVAQILNKPTNVSNFTNDASYSVVYIGDYKMSNQAANHGKWLLCQGAAVSRTTYAAYFALVGTSFGVGNGSTTFNLPDSRSSVLGSIGQRSGLTNRTLGAFTGAETHTLITSEIPSHNHLVPNNLDNSGSGSLAFAAGSTNLQIVNTITTSTGGGGSHNNMQPTLFLGNLFVYVGV